LPRQGPVSVGGSAILRGNSWRVSPKVSGRKVPFPRLQLATCPPCPISNGPWGFEPRHLTRFGWMDQLLAARQTSKGGSFVTPADGLAGSVARARTPGAGAVAKACANGISHCGGRHAARRRGTHRKLARMSPSSIDPFAKPSANARYLRTKDGWSRRYCGRSRPGPWTPQLGGKRAQWGRLGRDRCPRHSRRSIRRPNSGFFAGS
jgi:hypothetical protein